MSFPLPVSAPFNFPEPKTPAPTKRGRRVRVAVIKHPTQTFPNPSLNPSPFPFIFSIFYGAFSSHPSETKFSHSYALPLKTVFPITPYSVSFLPFPSPSPNPATEFFQGGCERARYGVCVVNSTDCCPPYQRKVADYPSRYR